MKKLIISILSLFILNSCVINPPAIDVEISEAEKQLVVNTFSLPPSIFSLILTRTFDATIPTGDTLIGNLDAEGLNDFLVDSVEIFLSYENKEVELTRLIPGIYGSLDAELKADTDYTLEVIDLVTMDKLTASTRILPVVELSEVEFEKLDEEEDSLFTAKILFDDPQGQDNYYLIASSLRSNSELPTLGSFLNSGSNYEVFSDAEFLDENQIEYELDQTLVLGDTVRVSLSHITKEYHDYLLAYKRVGSIFNSILSESIRNLPDNVEGGLGYFNLAIPQSQTVIVE